MQKGGNQKITFGKWGEEISARYLCKKGFRIKNRNFFTRYGELDIVAERAKILYFFEVKTRRDEKHGTHESFTHGKRQRFFRAIKLYMQAFRISDAQACECFVITVIARKGTGSAKICLWPIEP
jgi:Holliday junction resolvase-like predicted endonuclease